MPTARCVSVSAQAISRPGSGIVEGAACRLLFLLGSGISLGADMQGVAQIIAPVRSGEGVFLGTDAWFHLAHLSNQEGQRTGTFDYDRDEWTGTSIA